MGDLHPSDSLSSMSGGKGAGTGRLGDLGISMRGHLNDEIARNSIAGTLAANADVDDDSDGEIAAVSDSRSVFLLKSAAHAAQASEDEFGVVLSLVRVLTDGIVAKKWADQVVVQCGEVENIRKGIMDALERSKGVRTQEHAAELVERGLLNLRRFFMLVLVAAYELACGPLKNADDINQPPQKTFAAWFEKRAELKTIYSGIRGKESLRFASVDKVLSGPPPTEANELSAHERLDDTADATVASGESDMQREIVFFVGRRNGKVLTRGSILKSDHFPGCNRIKNAVHTIEGAPNFRQIITSLDPELSIGMYGTGIPTVDGLRGVLEYVSQQKRAISRNSATPTPIGADALVSPMKSPMNAAFSGSKPKRKVPIVWINLREEPILYVEGRPFVLRKLEHPFENLEHTGISRERVENMEDRLKVDVIDEIMANGNKILIHEEDDTGLVPVWQTIDVSEGSTSIQTPSELYEMLAAEYDVVHCRVPITDEMAPKLMDYDLISNIVRNAPIDAELVFNCQMGRGRTTTGLCIGAAVRLWERCQLFAFHQNFECLVAEATKVNVMVTKRTVGKTNDSVAAMFLEGRYETIGALTRVLDQGVLAKSTADSIIDCVDTLQNLREATYCLKVVSETDEKTPVQRAAALSRGIQYLRRYYQIIEFVDYLVGSSPEDRTNINSFAAWLRKRGELKSHIKKINLR